MADLAHEDDEAQASAAPEVSGVDEVTGGGVASLDGRCHVLPDRPLPALSAAGAQAFTAVDHADPSRQSYALIIGPHMPFRLNSIRHARELGDAPLVKPKHWDSIEWPLSGRRETMLLLERPPGEPLMASLGAEIRPLEVPDIAKNLMMPMVALLSALADDGLTHRAIRPTNLFRTGIDQPIFAGEFYSAPPGFNQPAIFEPIERAMCPPPGRGSGEIADDLFALGVTALFLVLGRNPVAGIDENIVLAKRVEMGSYAALTAEMKPPGNLAPIIRSLMHDSPQDRWTIEDLLRWADLGVANQAQPTTIAASQRPFEFEGGRYITRQQLALAFFQNWQAAREVVQTDAVERWAERSFNDRELCQQIVECRRSGSTGPRAISDDLLLARTIITLDPQGPLRWCGLNVMPDGFGAWTALAATDTAMSATFGEMVSSRLTEFWLEKQVRTSAVTAAGKADAARLNTYFEKTGPGFGIERCVYELNKGMACQSPHYVDTNAVEIPDLMKVLDDSAKKGDQKLDRHVAAFLGARYSGSIDGELADYANAQGGEESLAAQLKIFAAVQFKHGPRELPNLAVYFLNHLDTLLAPYRNLALRSRLSAAAERIAATGKLPELLGAIRNPKTIKSDKRAYEQARQRYRNLARQMLA
ncbi:MAG: hypothetical protein OER92_10015, partial [Alphaproteobacteria bacterium]|nr:hypothetical protein [Alphaproteobacteria bacterium]